MGETGAATGNNAVIVNISYRKNGYTFFSFYEDGSGRFDERIGQNMKIFLFVFQNEPFYDAKRLVLSREMIHSVEQNGPFSNAK
ncbi:MAG: hypothetical protein II612_05785 [Prevotella sp.]|nr:hypothetical protein [Prevotella sp.]